MNSLEVATILEQQGIVAENPVMRSLYLKAVTLASISATILLGGESGVGKDRLAKFIHSIGPRRNAPFIHINCSAIPQELFESELFGYESGTFTGGLNSGKMGLLEAADGGTVFLDEIGDMSLSNQVVLLTFLQSRAITKLGSGQPKPLNVRIISATNQNLRHGVSIGTFREDLYYRICVVTLDIPPLRERPEDIAALARDYISRNYPNRYLSDDAIELLSQGNWPGNIRELQNFLEKICIIQDEEVLTRSLIEPHFDIFPKLTPVETVSEKDLETRIPTLKEAVAEFEKEYIAKAIEECSTLSEAAIRLGIDLDTLNRKKRRYGLYKRWKKQ